MSHWRPTCLIRDWHAWLETNPDQYMYFSWVSDEASRSPMSHVGLWWGMLVSDMSPMRHVGLRWGISVWWGMSFSDEAFQSPMKQVGLRWDMSVSNGSPMRHVGLRRVFNQACRSPKGSPTGLRWVYDKSPIIIIFLWTLLTAVFSYFCSDNRLYLSTFNIATLL